ncbi:MAG: hypothetical protein QM235_11580 [Pseudomonadota bacterium]|nr:hypothetical protein [Pseudomonadota bacterium]
MVLYLNELYSGEKKAKRSLLPKYIEKAIKITEKDAEVVLTGWEAPIWLYNEIARALKDKTRVEIQIPGYF